MIFNIHRKDLNKYNIINILVLSVVLYLFRSSFPILKYPFLAIFLGLSVYSSIVYKKTFFSFLPKFIKHYYLPLLLLISLIASFIFSNKLYLIVFKDIVNAITLFSLFYLLTFYIGEKEDLQIFYLNTLKTIIYFSLAATILLLNSFFKFLPSTQLFNTITSDYNFVLLPIYFGLVGTLFLLIDENTNFKKGIYNGFLVLFTLTVLISGSRRGFITLGFIVSILIGFQFFSLFKSYKNIKIIARRHRLYLFNIFLLLLLSYGLIFKTSYFYKKSVFEFLGFKDLNASSINVMASIFRYISPLKHDLEFQDFYEKTWFANFDKALDPDSGWGTSKHKTVYPLSGPGSDSIPKNARGYLLDSTCNVISRGGNAYSYTLLGDQKVNEGDIVSSTVFCYISEDFDASSVQFFSQGSTHGMVLNELTSDSTVIDIVEEDNANLVFGNPIKLSNDNNLFLDNNFSNCTLYWQPNADSTVHTVIDTPFGKGLRVSRTDGDGGWWSLYYLGPKIIYHAGHKYQIKFKYKIQKGSDQPFNIGWWVNDAGFYPFRLPLEIVNLQNGWKEATCTYKFQETHYDLPTFLNSLHDFTIIDIADVSMIDLNQTDSLPSLVDNLGLIKMNNRGVWKKLHLISNCTEGRASVFIGFSKRNVTDFSSLKGHIIFAYPKYSIISRQDTLTSSFKFRSSESKQTVSKKDNHLKAIIHAGVFQSLISIMPITAKLSEDDPIRKLASVLVPSDTSYKDFHSNIKIDTVSNSFFGDRIMRWEFACSLFLLEYNLKNKILGNGFAFLNWYGYIFEKDKLYTDYPHNPLLSVLLYSGLLGLVLYLIFIYVVIKRYLENFSEYHIFVIYFAITLFFSFFSAGSPFDPPIMGFFMLLPYLMKYVKEKSLKR